MRVSVSGTALAAGSVRGIGFQPVMKTKTDRLEADPTMHKSRGRAPGRSQIPHQPHQIAAPTATNGEQIANDLQPRLYRTGKGEVNRHLAETHRPWKKFVRTGRVIG